MSEYWKPSVLIAGPEYEKTAESLASFVQRVALDKNATPAEIAALPEVAKVLYKLWDWDVT